MSDEKPMKESNASYEGGSNGALGGATMADLKRGYIKPEQNTGPELPYNTPFEEPAGFVGRPHGWDR